MVQIYGDEFDPDLAARNQCPQGYVLPTTPAPYTPPPQPVFVTEAERTFWELASIPCGC